jgi:hypothetical protein
MTNIPLTRDEQKKLGKGFHINQFVNRKTRRAKPDKFTQLKKAVEKRAEAKKDLPFSNTLYWLFRNRVNRLANKCYPKRATT